MGQLEQKERLGGHYRVSQKICRLFICREYRKMIEMEIHETCFKLLDLLENDILNKLKKKQCKFMDIECLVFYMKMTGDYYRYLCEIFDDNIMYRERARIHYNEAFEIATNKLKAVHPTRLGLALNFAVYLYEIAKEADKACFVAKTAFDAAIEELNDLNDASYKDATLIMRLLRDNLTLWTSESDQN